MGTIAHVSRKMQELLTTTVTQVAADLGFDLRPDKAKFSAHALVKTLVYGWMQHPDARLHHFSMIAHRLGVTVHPQAIDQRLNRRTATLLRAVLQACMEVVIAADPVALPILDRFHGVRIHDSTTIRLPDALAEEFRACGNGSGKGTAAMKCGVTLDLATGQLCMLDITDGRTSDHRLPLQHALPPEGSLRMADLGFYSLAVLHNLDAHGWYWLSRVPARTVVQVPGEAFRSLSDLIVHLNVTDRWEGDVVVGREQRLATRMIIERVPPEVIAQRQERVIEEAQRRCRPVNVETAFLTGWTVAITNVPQEMLHMAEALDVLRLRWQIELLFKLWKNEAEVDEWRSAKPERILCEIYAKLIACILSHWMMVASVWQDAERSMVKALGCIRDYVSGLVRNHDKPTTFTRLLTALAAEMQHVARIQRRKKRPSSAQRVRRVASTYG